MLLLQAYKQKLVEVFQLLITVSYLLVAPVLVCPQDYKKLKYTANQAITQILN
jgi:hypothetical protein